MIIRIVKMCFKIETTDEFEKIFAEAQPLIQTFQGCSHVELLNDTADKCIYFTISHWQSESDLEQYRKSVLFQTTWAKTKVLFSEKAAAWTVLKILP